MKVLDCLLLYWNRLQDFLDISGDAIMGLMSLAVVWSIFKFHDIGYGSAAAYSAAIAAFAASNIKTPKP